MFGGSDFWLKTRVIIKIYVLEWMGLNFYDYDGLQPKMTFGNYYCAHFGTLSMQACINDFRQIYEKELRVMQKF